jgi:hypothetical protein
VFVWRKELLSSRVFVWRKELLSSRVLALEIGDWEEAGAGGEIDNTGAHDLIEALQAIAIDYTGF